MKLIIFSRYLSVCLFLVSSFLSIQPAQAQRTTPLLSTICVIQSGLGFMKNTEQISIGRQVFESIFNMGASFAQKKSLITCKIKSEKFTNFKTLNMKFGIPDEDWLQYGLISHTKVSIYLDGKEAISRTLTKGDIENDISLDVRQTKNVAIEITCAKENHSCHSVHFIEAALLP